MEASAWLAFYYPAEWALRLGAILVVPQRRACGGHGLAFAVRLSSHCRPRALPSDRAPRFPPWRSAFHRDRALSARDGKAAARVERRTSAVASLAETLGGLPATGGSTIEFLEDYDTAVDRLVADIAGAKAFVLVTVYLFADDGVGRRVAQAMAAASRRG